MSLRTALVQLVEADIKTQGQPRQRVIVSLGDAKLPELDKHSIARAVTAKKIDGVLVDRIATENVDSLGPQLVALQAWLWPTMSSRATSAKVAPWLRCSTVSRYPTSSKADSKIVPPSNAKSAAFTSANPPCLTPNKLSSIKGSASSGNPPSYPQKPSPNPDDFVVPLGQPLGFKPLLGPT